MKFIIAFFISAAFGVVIGCKPSGNNSGQTKYVEQNTSQSTRSANSGMFFYPNVMGAKQSFSICVYEKDSGDSSIQLVTKHEVNFVLKNNMLCLQNKSDLCMHAGFLNNGDTPTIIDSMADTAKATLIEKGDYQKLKQVFIAEDAQLTEQSKNDPKAIRNYCDESKIALKSLMNGGIIEEILLTGNE